MNDTQGNKTIVSFTVSENATPLIVDILHQLNKLSVEGSSRKIRLGGKEHIFFGDGPDGIGDVKINDILIDAYLGTDPDESIKALLAARKNPYAPNGNVKTNKGDANVSTDATQAATQATTPVFVTPSGVIGSSQPSTGPLPTNNANQIATGMADDQKDKVAEVVNEFTAQGKQFTAWDVTKEVRSRMPNEKVFHDNVKAYVHCLFEQGSMPTQYTRSLASLPNVSVKPWLYYQVTDDPNDYDND